ncbi:MAG: recombinase RecA [Chloroflexi bacterium]|jgi:recombination protein RecA|nr:recombinase RecA [Chloroflexota bacterium]MBT3668954.1 recombinase RecA [Chloroflexota bacterium]MBT4004316.1 recombinase RecA [Chloroflexota bacterium]MBT4305319.1 recombinase RecA [Chloroflexota bacterium]MBT4532465.1 recombinase RecA [Chloroflexota bacterium]
MAKKKNNSPSDNGKNKSRDAALEKALGEITKEFGDGSIMRLGDTNSLVIDAIPTGALSVDIALGIGGIPRGRVTEIYGPESSGKTTLCQHIVAECQKLGGTAAFIDMEHALDPIYAEKCGVDVENLLISQPDTGEQALEITETLIRSGAIDLVVIDSVAALVPRSELEGDMGDATMGMQARLMSQALRKLSGAIKHTNTAVIFTNQLRQKIGVMFGNPETTTGGMALKFYSSVRIDIRRIQSIKAGTEVIGNRTRIRVVKNKVAPPFRTVEFDIMYNEGISRSGDLLDLAVELEVIDKRGSFYSYGETRLGQGREKTKAYMQENPDLATEIEDIIRSELLGDPTEDVIEESIIEDEVVVEEENISQDVEEKLEVALEE